MKIFIKMMILFVVMYVFQNTLTGQTIERSSGIILRGSMWSHADNQSIVSVSADFSSEIVGVGFGGGWIIFFSRTSDFVYLELSIGVTGQVYANSRLSPEEETDIHGVIPILLGMKHFILPLKIQNDLQPYFSFGGGPYLFSDIHIIDRVYKDEVSIRSKVKAACMPAADWISCLAAGLELIWI